jgi:transketolase
MRHIFVQELVHAARRNKNIMLIVGDLGYGVVEPFAQEFPERFFNAGIAEQSMMSMAAGLASEGYHPFVYSIANFPTFRCAEQVRNDVDYHNLPVTIVAVGGGLAYGNLGYSHHAIQDYALMRIMPRILIAAPGDSMEVRACVRYLSQNPQPSYLRLGKSELPSIHASIPEVIPGRWIEIQTPEHRVQNACVTTGAVLETVATSLASRSDLALFSLPLWGMSTKIRQSLQLQVFSRVTTVEDHLRDAGFGSWMAEAATEADSATTIRSVALAPSVCGTVGKQHTLNQAYGLSREILSAMIACPSNA